VTRTETNESVLNTQIPCTEGPRDLFWTLERPGRGPKGVYLGSTSVFFRKKSDGP
jgi:hypothetical protein